jgi:hypothetical protein
MMWVFWDFVAAPMLAVAFSSQQPRAKFFEFKVIARAGALV